MSGLTRLAPGEAGRLEEAVRIDPHDVPSRTRLIKGYIFQLAGLDRAHPGISGGDALQSLALGLHLIRRRLIYFIHHGKKLAYATDPTHLLTPALVNAIFGHSPTTTTSHV